MKLLALLTVFTLAAAAQTFEAPAPTFAQLAQSLPQASASPAPLRETIIAAALFTPIRTATFKGVIGRGAVTQWTVQVCNRTNTPIQIRREQVLMAGDPARMPAALPNDLAQDAVTRQAAADHDSIIGANGNAVITMGSTLASALGIAAKSTNTIYAAAALSAAQFFINIATKRAPNPAPYFSRLLPSVIPLGTSSGACDTWYLFASPIKDAQPIAVEVRQKL